MKANLKEPDSAGRRNWVQRPPLKQVFVALGIIATLTLIRGLAGDWLSSKLPFFLYLGAGMAMAWYGGFRLGMLTILISAALVHLLSIPPRGALLKPDGGDLIVLVFVAEGTLVCYLTELLRRARREGELVGIEFRLLVDGTFKHCLVLLDPAGRIKSWNHGARKVLGYSSAEIVEQHIRVLLPADEPAGASYALIGTAAESGRAQSEAWCVRKDSSRFRAVLALTALRNTRGQVSGFVFATYDVTDRWKAESALQERERQLRLMANSLPVLIGLIDFECKFHFVNDTYERWFGQPPEACLEKHVRDVLGESAAKSLESRLPALLRCEPQTYEADLVLPGGTRNIQVDCVPHRSTDGTLPGCYVLVADITHQKSIEHALRAGEERLRSIVNTAVDAIITLDRRGTIESVNRAAEQMFGHSSEEMVGQNIGLFLLFPDAATLSRGTGESARSTMRRMIRSAREIHAMRKDGTPFPVEITVSDVGSLGLFIGILRDVTHRMELEREVLEATATEQRRIGQELHDHVGQELTGLELLVDTLTDSVRASRGDTEKLCTKIAAGLRKTHREIRDLARGLIPVEIHPTGLREALGQLAERLSEQNSLNCRFQTGGAVQISDANIATHLYRITQEAVSNSIRHGHAESIDIRLHVSGDILTLEVEDDGVGIDASPNRGSGLGLRLMEYRASLISGVLSIEGDEAKGTKVTCRVPRSAFAPEKPGRVRGS
jgi:PAS domain S-box-containing protein